TILHQESTTYRLGNVRKLLILRSGKSISDRLLERRTVPWPETHRAQSGCESLPPGAAGAEQTSWSEAADSRGEVVQQYVMGSFDKACGI
ncbi:MAG: hypothetical protein SGI92_31440, partial [Bryobacteraceae bacterium]|nr:hypothetical protein [Bryobacteraceae bacterium]